MANPPRNSGESLIGTAATQPEAPRRIDLAHEPPIRLGPLVIEPPLREMVEAFRRRRDYLIGRLAGVDFGEHRPAELVVAGREVGG